MKLRGHGYGVREGHSEISKKKKYDTAYYVVYHFCVILGVEKRVLALV